MPLPLYFGYVLSKENTHNILEYTLNSSKKKYDISIHDTYILIHISVYDLLTNNRKNMNVSDVKFFIYHSYRKKQMTYAVISEKSSLAHRYHV